MGFWWTLNLVLLQSLWGAFWMTAFWPCKVPQLSGCRGERRVGHWGPPGCTLLCLQVLTDCICMPQAVWGDRSGRPCRGVGRLFFCGRQPLPGTHIHRVGIWATYYSFFPGEARNVSFTREFPMLWSNNKNSCLGQTDILVWPTNCHFVTSGWETEWDLHCLGAVERESYFAFGFNINPW